MVDPLVVVRVLALCAVCGTSVAQHCAPVYESYLSEISLKQSEDGIKFGLEYTIRGGAWKDALQAYLLAYLERDAARVPAPEPSDYIDTDVALVLHTQLITRNEDGAFDFEFQIDGDELAKKIIAHRGLSEEDRVEYGGWGIYKDHVRIAVFVPWLEDTKYSVIDGLPENRHCCNYTNAPALLFQTLPYRLSICFGIVKAWKIEPGRFVIEINGDRTPLSGWPPDGEESGTGERTPEEEERPATERPTEDEERPAGDPHPKGGKPGGGDSRPGNSPPGDDGRAGECATVQHAAAADGASRRS